jgi:hypothetical protein
MRMLLACLSFVVFAPLATARNLRHRRPMWAGRVLFPTSGPTGKPCLDVSARSRPHTTRTCMIMLSAQLIVVCYASQFSPDPQSEPTFGH